MSIALVTGASKGMGLEWCRQLAEAGYEVILTARNPTQAAEAAASLQSEGYTIHPRQLDVCNEAENAALAQWVMERFGKLDLLINNAGINSFTRAKGDENLKLKNLTIEHLDKQEVFALMDINAISPILLANHLRPAFAAAKKPVIINIGSWLGSVSIKNTGGNYTYAVSKSALNMMNRAFANDVRDENIVSVVVNPGWVQTDMGGQKAQFTSQEAVANMIANVVNNVTIADSGRFLNYDGSDHPW